MPSESCMEYRQYNHTSTILISLILRNLQTSPINNSKNIRIRNSKFAGYCFYMNTDFQIRINVPLKSATPFYTDF